MIPPFKQKGYILILGGLCILLLGCRPATVGGVETVITLHSLVGVVGADAKPSEACVWIVGRGGTGMGLSMVLAHGNLSVDDCVRLGPP